MHFWYYIIYHGCICIKQDFETKSRPLPVVPWSRGPVVPWLFAPYNANKQVF